MAGPPSLSRHRPLPSGNEEATTTLTLGDMTDVPTLSVSECNELLHSLEKQAEKQGSRATASSDVYLKTREYVGMFARFKDGKTTTQVDHITLTLLEKGVGMFERAQLASLCPDTAEEAKTLVPSLEDKIDDETLQAVLDEISKLRDFS
ncbi:hypothetical protein LTR62_005035 [Meristemomyces frigidus]|uniref:RNA polymerase Rpb4/RPC9 core domain-containing protein n=1 Tax=Meristemomyces frigidus TaxID=1508187 RepID=A0AAN7YKB1_9PEZI|nr:hypothetical protein LTR62_005035 [Meristemomyces frigidus]